MFLFEMSSMFVFCWQLAILPIKSTSTPYLMNESQQITYAAL